MRVVVTQLAASAHLNLVVPLGWALKAAGHDVVIAAQPDIMPLVQQTGLMGVAVGDEARYAERVAAMAPEETIYGSGYSITEIRPEVLTYEYVRDCLAAFASPMALDVNTDESVFDGMVDFCRSWRPDLVIWDSMTYTGPVAAAACGAAHARTTIGRDHWGRLRELFLRLRAERPEAAGEDPVRDWLTAKLEKYGCEYDDDLVLGQTTIDSLPSWLRLPADYDYLPVRYVAYNGPGTIPDWLRAEPERPRVCVTLGNSYQEVWAGRAKLGYPDLFEAVADLDIEVVALLGPASVPAGATVPDNVRIPGFVPLDPLLKSCSAIVHHAGTGSTLTALLNGVPQLIIPHALHDEDQVADAIEAHGVGVHLPPDRFSAETLRTELQRILNDSTFTERAQKTSQEIRETPTPHDLVKDLEEHVLRHRRTAG
ncbi:activator-dependent family glycosyltransferase [Nonomuraea angiospora]|uniref:Glycosyltransferase (Activator-dependent family) n=1 Tax=Nonomuraea angiospora TaxID=46172 RepID=A0ABR9MGI2_9ACTN|nr:activator-dependent family glycosyltransferase [Nonomuraea angiospora]MBE1592007.1 glycosyltransferase (activator-dependent family) [Nonomuraea angiospora]MDX3110286.1 activator-dependent family glycosyltransferase [Nonomuraea angiospora]